MDYGIQLGRRFRSLKLWFVIRYFGRRGNESRGSANIAVWRGCSPVWVEESDRLGNDGAGAVRAGVLSRRAGRLSEDELNALNERIMNEINASGEAYLSHTKLNGKFTLRLSVGSIRVEERHLEKVWEILGRNLITGMEGIKRI